MTVFATAYVSDVFRSLRSVRTFRDRLVDKAHVEESREDVATTPSGGNVQPCNANVITGALGGETGSPSVRLPEPLPEVFPERVQELGKRHHNPLKNERGDSVTGIRKTERKHAFLGLPAGPMFSADNRSKSHSCPDLDHYTRGVRIAAKTHGIDTCPQVSHIPFHEAFALVFRMHVPKGSQSSACPWAMAAPIPK